MTRAQERLGRLRAALGAAELAPAQERTLTWLSQWDDDATDSVITILGLVQRQGAPAEGGRSPAERAMRWALFDAPVSPGLSWMLAALASHAGPDGICRTNLHEISRQTLYPETLVLQMLAQLSVLGLITRTEAQPPAWRLHMDRVRPPMPDPPPRGPQRARPGATRAKRSRNRPRPA